MEILMEMGIPPLVIVSGTEFAPCGYGGDAHLWLEPAAKRRSESFVIHDPDGSLLQWFGMDFSENGYSVSALNLADIGASAKYNPFEYIRHSKDAPKVAAALICGTTGLGEPGDISLISLETLLYTALIGFIHEEAPHYEMNIATLMEMLEYMEPEDGFKTAIDCMFEQKEMMGDGQTHVRLYRDFKDLAGEDEQRAVDSCIARIAPLKTPETVDFLSSDELMLGRLTYCNAALFVISVNADPALSFLAPLLYSQLIDLLCEMSGQ